MHTNTKRWPLQRVISTRIGTIYSQDVYTLACGHEVVRQRRDMNSMSRRVRCEQCAKEQG